MLRCQYHFRRKFTITSGDHVSSKTGRDVSRGQWSLLSLRACGTFRPERCGSHNAAETLQYTSSLDVGILTPNPRARASRDDLERGERIHRINHLPAPSWFLRVVNDGDDASGLDGAHRKRGTTQRIAGKVEIPVAHV